MSTICIAGSHRSGTSMLARLLQLCGIYLGPEDEFMAARVDNPGGFWENLRFVDFNERLLNEFGAGWDCPPPVEADWHSPRLEYFRVSAKELIADFSAGQRHWGWKDPRNSLVVPFWQEIVPDIKVILMLRNPLDVAASLGRRNGVSAALGLTLWLRYNERVVAATQPDGRLVSHYDAYFADPAAELRRILEFAGAAVDDDVIESACETVSSARRHYASDSGTLQGANVDSRILDLYASLASEAGTDAVLPLPSNVLVGANGSDATTDARNGGGPRPTGNARIEPAGRLEQVGGQPSSLGRELAGLRSHFAEQASGVARLADELSRQSSLHRTALKRLERHQSSMLSQLEDRLGQLERVTQEASREHARRLDELSHICRYLASRIDTPGGGQDAGVRYQTAAAINAVTPPGATVILAGWGGRETSKLIFGRNLRYLPQTSQGGYVARHPSSSEAVLAQLEALRADGAEFAVFSAETLWWEEAYPAFWTYLERRYPRVWGLDQSARVYALKDRTTLPRRAWELDFDAGIREFRARADRDPAILDWADGIVTAAFPELAVFSPPDDATRLPYLPDSVDIVAVGAGRDRADARRVASAAVIVLEPLPDGSPSVTVEWTRQPRRRRSVTSASVVIPSWNGIEHTEKCVLALSETLPTDYDCEIVVVDDASTDDTPQRLAHLAKHEPRLRVIRNEKNSGFIVTCNRGAQESRGEFVIMLNNDTVPLPGWLEPLLAIFRHYPDAGAATGKLLFPDGSVQEAGGIVFSDARAANFGKWDVDNDCPLYNYVREVDYGSGALLALPRSLWNELGGFDLRYRPIYCDDSDLCFKIRQRGLRVYFQPECKVVHVEGATSGRDESTGDKRYQAINRKKFARRWAKELRRQPPYPAGFERPTLHSIVVRDEVDITMGTPS